MGLPKVLQGDVPGFGAAAHAGVEGVQDLEFLSRELEVEHIEVLGDPLRPY
jgi:hypothetical protein